MRKHSGAASSLSLHLRHHLRQLRREGSGHVQLWHRLRDLRCLSRSNPAPCGVCATTSAATRATSAARMVSATTTPCHACMCSLTNAGPSKGVAHDTSRGDLHHAISLYTRTCGYNRTLALGSSAGGLGGGGYASKHMHILQGRIAARHRNRKELQSTMQWVVFLI